MRARALRGGIVLLGLALLWSLPYPSSYMGGRGSYDVWSWGLYGWIRVYKLQSGFFFGSVEPVHNTYTLGLSLTVVASVLVALFGAWWVWAPEGGGRKQKMSGLLIFLIPASLSVIELWWPDVNGVSGSAHSFQYYRGSFGYLVEHRETFEVPSFPPQVSMITGTVDLNPVRVILTGLASIAVLTGAGWLGSKVSGLGLTPMSNENRRLNHIRITFKLREP
jgi:hypothetical protein